MRALLSSGASEATKLRVESLVMATIHDATPICSDEQLLVDIDLSILGAAPTRFAEYDRQVRAEYSWVPRFVYNMKRRRASTWPQKPDCAAKAMLTMARSGWRLAATPWRCAKRRPPGPSFSPSLGVEKPRQGTLVVR